MTYTFKNVSAEKLSEGINAIAKNGGKISLRQFSFYGVIGNYSHSNGILKVEITDKPWLASWGMIESKLNDFFS